MEKADIYIKQEGDYYSVRCHRNLKAMEFAHSLDIPNSLEYFGKTYCDEPVWYPGMKTGMYSFTLNRTDAQRFAKEARQNDLIVASEAE